MFTPQYSCNIAKVGVKHQSINQSMFNKNKYYRVRAMVFNSTFNNISVISWRSVLFRGGPGENHRPVASH